MVSKPSIAEATSRAIRHVAVARNLNTVAGTTKQSQNFVLQHQSCLDSLGVLRKLYRRNN
jgi:hypothetical protein